MHLAKVPLTIIMLLMACILYGCGEKTVAGPTSTKAEQSQACIDCHQSVVSPVTGKIIVEEWKLSHHNTSNGAGCADCHEPEQGHPTGCNLCHGGTPAGSLTHVSRNPDEDKKCAKCHGSESGLFPKGTRREHYGDLNAAVRYVGFERYTASYVSTNYIGKCRKCHNPHDPTSNIEYNRAWAKSGHGDVAAGARTRYDFKLRGTSEAVNTTVGTVCVRCHTTTGFVNFVESKFTDVKPFGTAADKTKEVTGCDACHSGYNFKFRTVGAVKIYYNFSGVTRVSTGNPGGHAIIKNNSITFPDLGTSNVCIPCHAGRGVGSQIKTLSANGIDFTKTTSPSAHDFSGASLLTAKSGYEFAGKEYVTGVGANTGHDAVGLSSGKGPCVTCHMNKATKSDSHTFKPVVHGDAFPLYTSNRTWSQVYSVSSSIPAALTITSLTSQSCNTGGCHTSLSATDLTSDKEGYISALAVLNKWARLVRYVPAIPQSPLGSYNAITKKYPNPARLTDDWTYLNDPTDINSNTGPDLMGVAFNLSMLNNEPGAYVHNPLYAKRLVYDSIFFLSTRATNPILGAKQYPTVQQFNVADAIYYLTATTARTLETTVPASTTNPTSEVIATITPHQADAAIKWLYGKARLDLSASDKLKRPGDN